MDRPSGQSREPARKRRTWLLLIIALAAAIGVGTTGYLVGKGSNGDDASGASRGAPPRETVERSPAATPTPDGVRRCGKIDFADESGPQTADVEVRYGEISCSKAIALLSEAVMGINPPSATCTSDRRSDFGGVVCNSSGSEIAAIMRGEADFDDDAAETAALSPEDTCEDWQVATYEAQVAFLRTYGPPELGSLPLETFETTCRVAPAMTLNEVLDILPLRRAE